MPSKNVYVAESDLPMFERASHLAGGMSAAVAAGLRLYLAQHEKNREGAGMETIELKVDDGGVVRTKRFSGRLLLRRKQNEGLRTRTFSGNKFDLFFIKFNLSGSCKLINLAKI